MRVWWTSLMPAWRRRPDIGPWPLSRSVPEDETWKSIRRVGAHGLLLVILGLFWWRSSATREREQNEYASMLEDVAWVLSVLAADARPLSERPKRVRKQKVAPVPAENTEIAPRSRRIIKPSVKKLASEGMSPSRAPTQKRSANVADLASPTKKKARRGRN